MTSPAVLPLRRLFWAVPAVLLLLPATLLTPAAGWALWFGKPAAADVGYEELIWDQLVPDDAFNFLQDYVDAEDVWSDQGFLDAVEKADRMVVPELDGKPVRLPGFMVPLELDRSRVTDFMIVPTPGACIHVPPPPPNQTILAHAAKPVKLRDLFQPVWIEGRIFVDSARNELAETSYRLEVDRVEIYRDFDGAHSN